MLWTYLSSFSPRDTQGLLCSIENPHLRLAHFPPPSQPVTPEELADDEEYADIMEDMREECGKYGQVLQVHIPRPGPPGAPPPVGLGKVLVEFGEPGAAIAARNAMHGRKFSGRTVVATLLTDDDYKAMKWD